MARPEPQEAEPAEVPTVIAFDPGGTTGWAVMMVHPLALSDPDYSILENLTHWAQGQIEGTENEQITQIIDLLDVWDNAAVVFEDFKLMTLAAELSPVRINAVMSWYLETQIIPARPMFMQMPSMKSGADDPRLKAWGLYLADGEEHARDGTRHAIEFLRRCKGASAQKERLRRLAWPTIYNV